MSLAILAGLIAIAIQSGTSVLYATLGEVITQRTGIVNLGIEGTMLVGAAVGFAVAVETGNTPLAAVAGSMAGGAFNLVLAFLVVTRRANQIASGLALMFLGVGLTALIGKPYVAQPIDGFGQAPIPGLSAIPYFGRAFFKHDVLVYLSVGAAIVLWWALFRTRWGLAVRATGEDRVVAYAAGVRPSLVQFQVLFVAGMLAGLGGAHLSLALTRNWIEWMTAGRGFIAVALVIFSMWHPLRAIAGAMLFGGAVALQLHLQARGAPVSPFLLDMLPYLLTLSVLLVWGRGRRHVVPAGLGRKFEEPM